MSVAMEPMKVPLPLHFLGNRSPVLDVQNKIHQLACHNACLMRDLQQLETAIQVVQMDQILAGPPGVFTELLQHLRLAMVVPPCLTKELISNHLGDANTCRSCDEVSSTHSETQMDDVKPLTQVVIKHLRSDLTRENFLDFLQFAGYKGKYNMVYLPINFQTGNCFQYAFVNFVTEEIGQQFQMQFQGSVDEQIFGQGQCEVSWSDRQGLPDIIEMYRNCPIMHPAVPENCKPALFQHGQPVPFPAPTRRFKKPRGLSKMVVNQNFEEAQSTAKKEM